MSTTAGDSSAFGRTDGVAPAGKRNKLQTSLIAKFVIPDFPMFESSEVSWTIDDFGASIDDIKFQDIYSGNNAPSLK